MTLLKNDEVMDFLTWPPTDFSALKNVQAKNAKNLKEIERILKIGQ